MHLMWFSFLFLWFPATNQDENEFVRQRAKEGQTYLLNRARFWSTQQPIVRPGTQAGSRASTAMPTAARIVHNLQAWNGRTKSEERPSPH